MVMKFSSEKIISTSKEKEKLIKFDSISQRNENNLRDISLSYNVN